MRVGLVSDTHGRYDEGLSRLFAGCDLILHAGDVVGHEILQMLSALAPVSAVKGNCDHDEYGDGLEDEVTLRLGELMTLVIHDVGDVDNPVAKAAKAIARSGAKIVVHGHSHHPGVRVVSGVMFVNPGSAGPHRFNLPCCAAVMTVSGCRVTVEYYDLDDPLLGNLGSLRKPFSAVL